VKRNGKKKTRAKCRSAGDFGDLTKRWCGRPKCHSSHHPIQFYILKSRFPIYTVLTVLDTRR
jgi:hypothetical protein